MPIIKPSLHEIGADGKTLRALNNLQEESRKTYLADPVAAGDGTLDVRNVNAFSASWAVQIGETLEENTEIVTLGTSIPSGTSLLLSGTVKYDHPNDTPVYPVKYDKMIFKEGTAGTASVSFTAITDGTVGVTPDSEYTEFVYGSGSTANAYKVSLYNSILSESSLDSDYDLPGGLSKYSRKKIRERIQKKLFDYKYIKDDQTINDWIDEWVEKMNNSAIDVNQDYSLGTADVSHGTDGLATITLSDFKEIRRVWFTTNGSDFYKASKKHITDYSPDETFNSTHPYYYMQGDDILGKLPNGDTGTARLVYYRLQDRLANDTTELPVSMKGYTKSFVDYSLAQAYYLDEKEKLGDRFLDQAENELAKFISEITPRSKSGPQSVKIVDSVSAEEEDTVANYDFF